MFIFFIANLIVGLTSLLIVRRLYRSFSSVDAVLAWSLLFISQILITELLLGTAGKLFLPNLLILNFIIFLAVAILLKIKKDDFSFNISGLSFIFENKPLLCALGVFISFFAVKIFINLINPPICPDSHQYHLSFPAKWLLSGNLSNPLVIFGSKPTSAELTALMYYPINAELLFFWLMAPLRNAFLADIGEAPFYLLGILALYSILRKFSVRKDLAFFAGLLWALIPNLFKQMRFGSQIDVLCATLVMLALNFLLLYNDKLNLKSALLFGISCGILIGTKVTNIFWLMAFAPLFIWVVYKRISSTGKNKVLFSFAAFFIPLVLLGSFSYIKTFILTGNPFYPVSLTLFGRTVFPGFIDKDTFSNLFVHWNEFSLKDFLFGEGLGVQLFAFVLPGTFIPLSIFNKIKNKFAEPVKAFSLFCIPVIMLAMYFFMIKAFWTRYLFPYLGIGLICMVIFVSCFEWGKKYIVLMGFISVVASAVELAHRKELIASLLISFVVIIILLVLRERLLKIVTHRIGFVRILLSLFLVYVSLVYLNNKYNVEEFKRYPGLFVKAESGQRDIGVAWQWLNDNGGSGKRIAYTGRSEFYPLFGERIKNDVFYISVNDKLPFPHLYSDGLYRREKDFVSWRKNLKEELVNILFVGLPHDINNESDDITKFPIEDEWARSDKEEFKLIFENSKARIYSVNIKDN